MARIKRMLSLILCFALVAGYIPAPVLAEETGLCEHHPEHVDCGYVAAVAGADCTHEHGNDCYTQKCAHVHGDCGYVAAVEGVACDHQHDDTCGYTAAVAESACTCTPVENVHAEGCTYAPAVPEGECSHEHGACSFVEAKDEIPCGHDCAKDAACSEKVLTCLHEHDEECGYAEAREAVACDFVCEECANAELEIAAVEEHRYGTVYTPYTHTNDSSKPYSLVDGIYYSTNHTKNSAASYTIAANFDTTISFNYGVSSESGCDEFTLKHNETQLFCISGLDSGKLTIDLSQGDVLVFTYEKDDSESERDDRGWFEITSGDNYLNEELTTPNCRGDVCCLDCGEVLYDRLPHNIITVPAVEPTCTTEGKTSGQVCSECGFVSVAQDPIPMAAHSFVNGICTICETVTYSEGITFKLNDDGTFYIVSGIGTFTGESLVIPQTYNRLPVKEIGVSAFANCSKLTSVTIPSSITAIGDKAFHNCTGLKGVYISDLDAWCDISFDYESEWDEGLWVESYSNPLKYAHNLYLNGEKVTDIVLSDAPNAFAFYGCSLNSVTFTCQVGLNTGVFRGSSLREIYIPGGPSYLRPYSLYSCSNITGAFYLPASVTEVGDWTFWGPNIKVMYLEGSKIPNRCDDLDYGNTGPFYDSGANVVYNCQLVQANGNDYIIKDGEAWFIRCPQTRTGTVEILSQVTYGGQIYNVTQIGNYAFYKCDQITSITIPDSITSIGQEAFSGCSSLRKVNITDIASWCNITFKYVSSNPLYYNCELYLDGELITDVQIPDSVTSINDYAFYGCDSLTSITMGSGVTSIGYKVFENCSALSSVILGSGLNSIGVCAFCNCASLTNIVLPDTVTMIDSRAFENCTGLSRITIPSSVTNIGYGIFGGCLSLKNIRFESDAPTFNQSSFDGLTATVEYPANNPTWTADVMQNCGGTITWVAVNCSDGHKEVVDEAVAATCTTDGLTQGSHCSVCGEVIVAQEVIPAGHTVVDGICTGCQNYGECGNGIYWKRDENYTMTFYGTGAIESGNSSGNPAFDLLVHNIIISEGITDIGTGLFGYLGRAYLGDGLQSVNIASTVTSIGVNAFANCGNVSSITFNGDAPAIDVNAFAGLTATAFYPDGNDTWTDVIKETYGGNITWVATGSDSSEPSEPVPTMPPEETEPTEDGLVDLTIYAYYYVDSEYHHKTELLTHQFVQDSLSNSMVTWLYGDGISAVKAALDKLGDAGGYLWDPIVFYNCIGDSEISEGDVMVADGNKAVYVKVVDKEAVNASVVLHVHTAQEAAIARTVTMPGYIIGDTVSAADVLTKVGEYYTGDNMTMSDLYDAVSWEDLLSGLEASGATAIKVDGDTVEIHVILTNAEAIRPVIGTVKQNLNVRSAPSTTASIVKQLEAGTQVEILKTQTVMDVEWGLTADGWIVMAYVDLLEASGTCGENLTWEFYKSTGKLIISGTGDMDDYSVRSGSPWSGYAITQVVIRDGVTSIGAYAFNKNNNLADISMPEGIVSIGEKAFYGCDALTGIRIPGSVATIGTKALADCGSLLAIEVDDSNPYFTDSACGGLFSKDQTVLYQIPAGIADSCIIPDTVTEICESAFEGCRNLTEILIPEDITTIGSSAFYNCSSLTAITLPVGITEISTSTFKNCTNLREITIPESVVSIGSGAFYDCLNLSVITFRGDAPTISAGSKITIKPFYNVKATAYYPADNATWTEEVMQNCGGTLTWVPYGQTVENRVSVSLAELNGQTSVWIDGREYAVQTDGDMAYVDLPDSRAKTMMVYTYHVGDAADVHTQYPIGMKVWLLTNTDGYYAATRTEAFDDILQYAGMSIRVFGQKGIRMITSIDQATKTALTSGGLEGYTLKEYGTVIAWDGYLTATKPLVLDASYAKYNYAYKQGIADPVFQYVGDRMQYTNVLVDFTNDQCKNDLAMRPYMILEHENGERITLYGGIVRRSIGYIAYQNRNVFEPGSDPYEYVWEIIRYVYGTKYDKEYIISWSPPAM